MKDMKKTIHAIIQDDAGQKPNQMLPIPVAYDVAQKYVGNSVFSSVVYEVRNGLHYYYQARKDVPAGIPLENKEYWKPITGFEQAAIYEAFINSLFADKAFITRLTTDEGFIKNLRVNNVKIGANQDAPGGFNALVNEDGSGHLAGGGISWEKSGNPKFEGSVVALSFSMIPTMLSTYSELTFDYRTCSTEIMAWGGDSVKFPCNVYEKGGRRLQPDLALEPDPKSYKMIEERVKEGTIVTLSSLFVLFTRGMIFPTYVDFRNNLKIFRDKSVGTGNQTSIKGFKIYPGRWRIRFLFIKNRWYYMDGLKESEEKILFGFSPTEDERNNSESRVERY